MLKMHDEQILKNLNKDIISNSAIYAKSYRSLKSRKTQ